MTVNCYCSVPSDPFSAVAWSRPTWLDVCPLTAGKRAAASQTPCGRTVSAANTDWLFYWPSVFYTVHLVLIVLRLSFRDFVLAFIHFKKPIVVAINGPALGLGASILPLCDVVWASERAWFQLPCAAIHLTPSGCSSYTFPQILGVAMVGHRVIFCFRAKSVVTANTIAFLNNIPSPMAGQWNAILWNKDRGSRSLHSRPGVPSFLAKHVQPRSDAACEGDGVLQCSGRCWYQ